MAADERLMLKLLSSDLDEETCWLSAFAGSNPASCIVSYFTFKNNT